MEKVEKVLSDHPGTYIAEELEARGWSQADLAFVLDWDVSQLNRLIKGSQDITPDSANALADAFGMPPEFFLNLQQTWSLGRAKKADPGVKTRAGWASVYPVREMIKRGWIEDTESSLLELQMVRFFGKKSRDEVPFVSDASIYPHAARKQSYADVTPSQYAWIHRVKQIAETINCPPYSEHALRNELGNIRAHFIDQDDLVAIPRLLKKCGVRLVLVEQLTGSKIDGVCLWLENRPVIGITNRLDRLDNLCFVLRHEIEHVLNGDGKEDDFSAIDDFDGNLKENSEHLPDCEVLANRAAAEFCVDQTLLKSFIARKGDYISEKDVRVFASRVQIHPGIVVGQIQRHLRRFNWLRKYQTSVRDYIREWEGRDGWGVAADIKL